MVTKRRATALCLSLCALSFVLAGEASAKNTTSLGNGIKCWFVPVNGNPNHLRQVCGKKGV